MDQVSNRTKNKHVHFLLKGNKAGKHRRPSSDHDGMHHHHEMVYVPLNDTTRMWVLAAAKNDEAKLRSLINENPKIFLTRDPGPGYTALHWAAKYGNDSMIHLLIGRYKMNPDIRTRGGYTPLMLAAMHRRETSYQLLLNPYGADPNLRDYSGKRAEYYLPKEEIHEGYENGGDATDGVRLRGHKGKRGKPVDRNSSSLLRDFVRESKRFGRQKSKTDE